METNISRITGGDNAGLIIALMTILLMTEKLLLGNAISQREMSYITFSSTMRQTSSLFTMIIILNEDNTKPHYDVNEANYISNVDAVSAATVATNEADEKVKKL